MEKISTSNNVCEIIKKRKTMRSYIKKEIPKEDLQEILSVTESCPTALNKQGYQIYVVKNQETKDKLCLAAQSQKQVSEADVVLVFFADLERGYQRNSDKKSFFYSVQDATIATSYCQIAAHALGIGCCWVGAFKENEVIKVCKTKKNLRPISMLTLGYTDPEYQKKIEAKGKKRKDPKRMFKFL
ncbi:nad(p)h nitroreductase ydgi-related [Anaeramoeba ignava]|uniref:Nad(P)h nitroreductase ydgi-related n=1 Tax=Anaeramoeba ignava TaxID=1746090 RepID=A0A9Q0LHZ4_ANAIG|nr:nad(p)h nitroreductase ydgi-related [Anaeramoeba ignava]